MPDGVKAYLNVFALIDKKNVLQLLSRCATLWVC